MHSLHRAILHNLLWGIFLGNLRWGILHRLHGLDLRPRIFFGRPSLELLQQAFS